MSPTMTVESVTPVESLRSILEREHHGWMAELGAALSPAQQGNASAWARWSALRYLERDFPERLMRERRLVEGVAHSLSESDKDRLWALGELLEVLPAYLGHMVGLCHRAGEFTALTARILGALSRWCRAVEQAVGPLPVTAVPAELRASFRPPAEPAATAC